jgi:hypothetical protein
VRIGGVVTVMRFEALVGQRIGGGCEGDWVLGVVWCGVVRVGGVVTVVGWDGTGRGDPMVEISHLYSYIHIHIIYKHANKHTCM